MSKKINKRYLLEDLRGFFVTDLVILTVLDEEDFEVLLVVRPDETNLANIMVPDAV